MPVYLQKQVWGVDPSYKASASRWRNLALWLLILLLILLTGTFFGLRYVFRNLLAVNINKR